ncbi:MAG: carboxypeptidase regulatory-like domain-containing protein [Acidobacteriota bacterium]
MKYPGLLLSIVFYFSICLNYAGSQVTKQGWPLSPFKKAAEEGDPMGQYLLGMAYLQGDGITQDYKEAAGWLSRAAEQDHPKAQFQLGILLLQGRGLAQDYKAAADWFLKAAEQNLPDAQFNLGLMYLRGEGVSRNYGESYKWFSKAAEQGDTSAQCMLGGLYIEGYGVEKDYIEAYKWLTLSAASSTDEQILGKAKNWRDLIARNMTSQQIDDARKMAQDWKAVPLFKQDSGRVVLTFPRSNPTDENTHTPELIKKQGNLAYVIEGTRQMNATLQGRVTDSDGKPLSNVAVDYINLGSGKGGGLIASPKGEYKFAYYPGPFSIEVTRKGYKPWSRIGIILEPRETQHLDIVLLKEKQPINAVTLKPEDYARRAVESVRKKWESTYTDRFQYEVAGEPVVRPAHNADASRKKSGGRAVFGIAPKAMVLVKVHDGERIHYTALVSFVDGVPDPQVAFYSSVPFGSMARNYLMEEGEWSRVVKDLESFYETALDISKGPERFDPFIQPVIEAAPEPPGGLSKTLASRVVCLRLHEFTLRNRLQFEGLVPDDSAVRRASVELNRVKNPDDLPGAIKKLSKEFDKWSEMLKEAGALDPDHMESASAYLRRMLGEGLIYKTTVNSRQKAGGLTESTMIYYAFFCHLGCNVQIAYIDGKSRIVGFEGLN